jgi:cellobiose-specific phosphotransferase system component IIB
MRREASARALDLEIHAGSDAELDSRLADTNRARVDAVLVGHHLAASYPDLRSRCEAAGIPCALLPTLSFDATGAAVALDAALELVPVPALTSATSQHPITSHEPGSPHG